MEGRRKSGRPRGDGCSGQALPQSRPDLTAELVFLVGECTFTCASSHVSVLTQICSMEGSTCEVFKSLKINWLLI